MEGEPLGAAPASSPALPARTRGASWLDANEGFPLCPHPSMEASCANATYLFAGASNDGVWRIPLAEFGRTDVRSAAVAPSTALLQNAPNPVIGSTMIEFSISRPGKVELTIYDALGRRIAEVLSAELPAGLHRVQWDATNAAAGVYFCRLRAGDILATRRLVVGR